MLMAQRGETRRIDTLPDARTWGPRREYAWNTAKAGQRIAPRGVQLPTGQPPGIPLVRTRSDAESIKGAAGNSASHTPTNPPTPPATLKKATPNDRPHA